MKALVLKQVKEPLVIEERPEPKAGAGQVVVRLRAAALNRRDFWITQGLYPGMKLPVVLGSDGAGIDTQTSREVIINPGINWGKSEDVQNTDFKILGMPDDGTFAEEVVVPAEQVHPKPGHLSFEHAAALPLASLTAYRALFVRGKLQKNETVVITGIGGGVACIAMQLTVDAGATVLVTSSSQTKIDKAKSFGAAAGFLYTNPDYVTELKDKYGPVHLIIDGAGGDGFGSLIEMAAPGGRIVNYGGTAGIPNKLELRKVFWKQLNILGSTMGSPRDFAAMLELVNKHKIKPIIDEVFPLAKGNDAFQKMNKKSQFGKLVLTV
jgi:zinc-binding alcohol dehydrogenase/oxidoreductase